MKRAVFVVLAVVAVSILAFTQRVSAQPETVPRELALRLLSIYGAQNAELYVGQLPPESRRLEQIILPEGARVVGSTVSEDRPFFGMTVYLNVAGSAEEVLRFYDARLPQADWERQQEQGYVQAGFLPNDAAFPESRGFCKDDVILFYHLNSYKS